MSVMKEGDMIPRRNHLMPLGRRQPTDAQRWYEENRELFSQPQNGYHVEEAGPETQSLYAMPRRMPPIDTQPTMIVPIPQGSLKPKFSYPPYTYYRSVDNALLRLYGACIAFRKEHRRLPAALVVSKHTEVMVAHESFAFWGKEYVGRFFLVHPDGLRNIKSFPVLTENDLPPLLALAFGKIDDDVVI